MKDSTSPGDPTSSDKTAGLINRRNALKTIAGAATAVGVLTQLSSPSANAAGRSDTASLELLDKMASSVVAARDDRRVVSHAWQ